jgi:hypothetical protein
MEISTASLSSIIQRIACSIARSSSITKFSQIMSRAAKLTLAGTSLFAVGTIFFVHFQQQAEKAVRAPSL